MIAEEQEVEGKEKSQFIHVMGIEEEVKVTNIDL